MPDQYDPGKLQGATPEERLAALEEAWRRAIVRFDARYKSVAKAMALTIATATILFSVGAAVIFSQQGKISSQQKTIVNDRYRASFLNCLKTNAGFQANVTFLRILRVPDKVITIARHTYPIEPSCPTYVIRLYGPHAPKHAFDVPPNLLPKVTATPSVSP